MGARGTTDATMWRGSALSLITRLFVVFALLGHCDSAAYPSATSWIAELGAPTSVGQLCSAVNIGHYTFLFGGLGPTETFVNLTLGDVLQLSQPTSVAVNYFESSTGSVGVPVTLPRDTYPLPWRNISSAVAENASAWVAASLPQASFGPNNAVVVGSTVYSLAMCNVVPMGTVVNGSQDSSDAEYFRSGWRMTVVTDNELATNVTPSHSNATNHSWFRDAKFHLEPRVQITEFSLSAAETPNPRFNASCVAHGSNIYIVGGVQLPGGTVTSSVAVYDTINDRYIDSVWNHAEAVASAGVTSDDSFVYIVGGQLSNSGEVSAMVYAHHMPSNVRVFQSAYPTPPFYDFPVVDVANSIIMVTGAPYSSIATWSMRLKNAFPYANPNSYPNVVGAAVLASVNDRNVTFGLFGGTTPNAGLSRAVFQCVVTPAESLWGTSDTASPSASVFGIRYYANTTTKVSPDWIPNNNGNVTMFVDRYPVLWDNISLSLILNKAELESICNISAGHLPAALSYCTFRLARSSRCDDPYVPDVVVSSTSVAALTIKGMPPMLTVGPFAPIVVADPDDNPSGAASSSQQSSSSSPREDASDVLLHSTGGPSYVSFAPPSYVQLCLSTSPYQVPGCVSAGGDVASTDCLAFFFTALNDMTPYLLLSSSNLAPPSPPSSAPVPRGSSDNQRKYIFIGVGCAVLVVLVLVAVFVWRRSAAGEGDDDDDDDVDGGGYDDPETSLLFGRKTPTRANGAARSKAQSPAGQSSSPALLDGKYRVLQRLGKGSFSVVYLVERASDGQKFALKYVQIADDTDRHEAMKECEVVHKLQGHPNVIQLHDMFMSYRFDTNLGSDAGSPMVGGVLSSNRGKSSPRYFDTTNFAVRVDDERQAGAYGSRGQSTGERYLSLVMEYHERGDLGRWVRRQKGEPRIPEASVLSIAFQVLSVLNYMHQGAQPIIHRDLKPENILLCSIVYENMSSTFLPIVVTDFGLSRVMDKTFCETGVGSLPYVAPECWQRCYSTKVDIWAVGCILYAVCAKRVEPDNVRVMFSESSRPDFHKKLFTELHNVYGYSEGCAKFIISLLEVDAEQRPTAAAALKRLKKRRAVPSLPGARREVCELDPDKALEKNYDSAEMTKDAQCEFYVPPDTLFPSLSSGWIAASNSYHPDRAGLLKSGTLPPVPHRGNSVGSSGAIASSTPTTSSRDASTNACVPHVPGASVNVTSFAAGTDSVTSLDRVPTALAQGSQRSPHTTDATSTLAAPGEAPIDRQHSDEEQNAAIESMKSLPPCAALQ